MLAKLSLHLGHEMVLYAMAGAVPVHMVMPAHRHQLALPFWQAYRADTMRPHWPTDTAEAAVIAFALGAHRWLAAAARGGSRDVGAELRARLVGGPVPAALLLADFRAAGVSPDRLSRAARRLGVVRTKAGMRGGWMWSVHEDRASP